MKILERIISVYASLDCVSCGVEGRAICQTCVAALPLPVSHCYRCNEVATLGRTCGACRKVSSIVSANAAVAYRESARDLIWRLKFGRVQAIADSMAAMMVGRYGSKIADDVLIVPVPTATKRVRGRGYDQAVLIARAVARLTGCSYTPLLLRVGAQEQIGAGKTQRRDQLQGVFQIRNAAQVQGSRILLIDDVITTGATLETAAALLQGAGARAVGALVFAQAEMRS